MKKTIIIHTILILFLILAIYLIQSVGINEIYKSIINANPLYISLGFLSLIFMHLINTTRWRVFLKPKIIKFPKLFLVYLAGAFVTLATPTAGVGGEPIRGYYVSKVEKRSLTESISTAAIEKVVYGDLLLAFPIIFSFIYAISKINIPLEIKSILITGLIFAIIFLAISISIKHNFAGIRRLIEKSLTWLYKLNIFKSKFKTFKDFKVKVHKSVIEFFDIIKKSSKDKKLFFKGITLGIVSTTSYFLSFYFLFIALNYQIPIAHLVVAISIARFIALLAFLPGGIGITESSLFALFTALSVNPVVGASVILIQRGFSYLIQIGFGYLSLVYLGLNHHKFN